MGGIWCFVGLLWFGTGILSLELTTLLVDVSCLPLLGVEAPIIMQDGFLLRRDSYSCGPAARPLGRKEGMDATQEVAPQLLASPGTHSGLNVQHMNSLWHYWEQCHPCGTGISAWLVQFPCPASSWLFCSLPLIAVVPVQALVCTHVQFVPVQAPVWGVISVWSCAPHCLCHQECPPGTSLL